MRQLIRSAVVGALSLTLMAFVAPASEAKTPPPPRSLASKQIDAHLGYQPQSTCDPTAKPGATALLKLLISTWGGSSSGISRACSRGRRSEHKEGRALDWHMDSRKAHDRKQVARAVAWITANHGEVARRLGIMYVIWNQRIWSTYYPELRWRKMEDRGSFTENHKDHVHISLSWDGAYKQTSWWTGRPMLDPINSACGASTHTCLPTIARGTRRWPYQKTFVPSGFTPAPWKIPGVGGSPQVGRRLRSVPGTWVPEGAELSYQWLSNGNPIAGATSANYVIGPEQVGRDVEVKITATTDAKTITKKSKEVAKVYPGRLATTRPKLAGKFSVGKRVRVVLGTWSPVPSRVRYSWLRDGKVIKGATGDTFKLKGKDRRHRIAVRVRASRFGYYTAVVTSASRRVAA